MTRRSPRNRGRQAAIEDELKATNTIGGYFGSIICTEQGLLVASDGDIPSDEALAGFASLFDEIVRRADRDLGLSTPDEVTLLDKGQGRLVIRPVTFEQSASKEGEEIKDEDNTRLFLVIWMNADATWRRNTSRLVVRLKELLAPVVRSEAAGA